MDTETIVRMLTNSGFNVRGLDPATNSLIIEDPSCIMRNFETFLDYAWVFITLITVILLFGWAISKIRGANTDIATNIRNLLIMFGVLSAAPLIINIIYGEDLMARTCHDIKIPLDDVQKILEQRNAQLSPDDNLFEAIDIFDSGMRSGDNVNPNLQPIDVPNVEFEVDPETGKLLTDPNTGEVVPIYNNSNDITNPGSNVEFISQPNPTTPFA